MKYTSEIKKCELPSLGSKLMLHREVNCSRPHERCSGRDPQHGALSLHPWKEAHTRELER